MARPRIHKAPGHPLFDRDIDQLVIDSGGHYHKSYLFAIRSGRQPANPTFRAYWAKRLQTEEGMLFKEGESNGSI